MPSIKTTEDDFVNLSDILLKSKDSEILSYLRSFGRAPKNFPYQIFIPLLKHRNSDIRFLAVKHLGKFSDQQIITYLTDLFKLESNSLIKREIISSIGRKRSVNNIMLLLEHCDDDDPKIVLQAIRGLLYFRTNESVNKKLNQLKNHPNEIISTFLQDELQSQTKNKKFQSNLKDKFENSVIKGDVREVLRKTPTGIVDLTFTSPPYYNARDYSIYKSYEEYIVFLEEVFKEVHRVTAEGRFFILNTSPVILPRVSRKYSSTRYAIPFDIHNRIVKLGFDFIDDIIWAKPPPSAKNRNGGFFQHRKPLGYKPNVVIEYVMVYRKRTNKLIDWNMKQYHKEIIEKSKVKGDYEMTNLWQLGASTDKTHPAPFPKKLVERVIRYYSYEGDLILDPFAGSGTVGTIGSMLNRKYLLIDNNESYVQTMIERLHTSNFTPKCLTLDELSKF
jgi:DNA modification methylase